MTNNLTISQAKLPIPAELTFTALRELGIKHLQTLSGQLWTDYNLHDPGVTILEVLCYAITDLAYRTNFDIEDLLALNPGDASAAEDNFFTPDQILTCNPLTELDWRRRLIDIGGVRNAWLEPLAGYEPALYINWDKSRFQYELPAGQTEARSRFHPRGLYRVWLDLEADYSRDACGQPAASRSSVLDEVNRVLAGYRNLCEDNHEVAVLEDEHIALCTDIDLSPEADPEDVLVEIQVRLQAFLMPQVRFYTLQELLKKGKSPGEIFAGRPAAVGSHDSRLPYPSHGFIDIDELEAITQPTVIYASDLYQVIMAVPGVAAVRQLTMRSYINQLVQVAGEPWSLTLAPGHRPTLDLDHSVFRLFKENLPLPFAQAEVRRRYFEEQEARIKTPREPYELDLGVPSGQYYNTLGDHYSIHHDFPLTYGISQEGLPGSVPAARKAQAKQLKGYLVFFDQLLANYLAQLTQVRQLFSWKQDLLPGTPADASGEQPQTYFTQAIDFPGWQDILTREDYTQALAEDPTTYRERRNRFLDHLLARFAESFTDYALLNYQVNQATFSREQLETELIKDKAQFLEQYPQLGRDRFRAYDYTQNPVWGPQANVAGFKQRVARLLGIDHPGRSSLSQYRLEEIESLWAWTIRQKQNDVSVVLLEGLVFYDGRDGAKSSLESYLSHAQEPDSYVHLRYYDSYRFGWIVKDSQGEPLVRCDRIFPDPIRQAEALASILALVPSFTEANSASGDGASDTENKKGDLYTTLGPDATGRYSFQLTIPTDSGEPLTFSSLKPYLSKAEADAAAKQALDAIGQRDKYCAQVFPHVEETEDESGMTSYGFAVANPEGVLLGQSPRRYRTAAKRDEAIQELMQFAATLDPDDPKHFQNRASVYLGHLTDAQEETLFYTRQPSPSRALAWQQSQQIMELLQDRQNLQLIDSDRGLHGWLLTSPDRHHTLVLKYYASAEARDAALADLSTYLEETFLETEGFYVLEHILLRPKTSLPPEKHDSPPQEDDRYQTADDTPQNSPPLDQFLPLCVGPEDLADVADDQPLLTWQDPYSFWVSVILPAWPRRFRDFDFRCFIERTLRLEAPAHVALKIAWLDPAQMAEFEAAYRPWLEQTALASQERECDRTDTLNQLIDLLTQLRSVYPQGHLYDPDVSDSQTNPILLNQTALGNSEVTP